MPNLGDIRHVDWTTVEPVDVVSAGFPCQDVSSAGRRAGIRYGSRSSLWHEVIRAIDVLRPTLVVVENVAALRWRNGGMDIVLADLADTGYDCVWNTVRASLSPGEGANHDGLGRTARQLVACPLSP